MLLITCLLWGDDPSQGFLVNLSPKDTIYSLKEKIMEQLDLGNNIARKLKLIRINEFVTLDDKRLKQIDNDPKDLFKYENLDKPFQILDEYFTAKDDGLKEFPLDVIALINDISIPSALLDKKENEPVIMAPHKPIPTIIRESAVVSNNNKQSLLSKKNILIDPSLFPSTPSISDDKFKEMKSSQTNLNNIDADTEILPRTKSIIFNIDRFPSPPSDNEEISNRSNNNNNNNNNNNIREKEKDKYVVYDIDQFPDAPLNEDYSITSKLPLTYNEDSPPSYDAISNKNKQIIPNNINNNSSSSDNTYTNINSNINDNQIKFIKKDKKSKSLRKQILITSSLCLGIIISTLLVIFISKALLSYKGGNPGPPKAASSRVISIGKITTTKKLGDDKMSSTIVFASTTVYSLQTYHIYDSDVKSVEKEKQVTVKVSEPYLSELRWNMEIDERSPPSMSLDIVDLKNDSDNKQSLKTHFVNNKNIINNSYNTEMKINTNTNTNINTNTNTNTNININTNIDNNHNYNYKTISDASMMLRNDYNNGYSNNYNNNYNNNYDKYNKYYVNDNNEHIFHKRDDDFNKNMIPEVFDEEKGPINKFVLDKNNFSLNVSLTLRRIVEVNRDHKRTNSTNFIEFTPLYETKNPEVFDNSDNINGGDIYYVREFLKLDNNGKKEVSVIGKTFNGKEENKLSLQSPTVSRFLINIKHWDPMYENSFLHIEADIETSADLYWSNVSKKSIYFGEGQGVLRFSEMYSDLFLSMENDKDIYSDQKKGSVAFVIYGNVMSTPYNPDRSPRAMQKNEKQNDRIVVINLEADLNKFVMLKELTSSGISYIKFNNYNSNYLLLFISTILTLYFIII